MVALPSFRLRDRVESTTVQYRRARLRRSAQSSPVTRDMSSGVRLSPGTPTGTYRPETQFDTTALRSSATRVLLRYVLTLLIIGPSAMKNNGLAMGYSTFPQVRQLVAAFSTVTKQWLSRKPLPTVASLSGLAPLLSNSPTD